MSYVTLLLLLHIGGAIVGFGPLFGFAVMGPLSGRLGGPQALGIMKAMAKIQRGIVLPLAVVQGITGALLIAAAGWDVNFGSHVWLWVSILLYLLALLVAFLVLRPALANMVALAEGGKAGTPEFGALVRKTQTLGPALTILVLIIIILMVLKPGG
jgi:uncharacterized membrane protein